MAGYPVAMLRRVLCLLAALGLLNVSGCSILSILAIPFQILMSIFGFVGDGLGSLVDAVVMVEPLEGPPPQVRMVEPGEWALDETQPGSRFRVTVSAPGHVSRQYLWPDDFPQSDRPGDGTIRVSSQLEPVASAPR